MQSNTQPPSQTVQNNTSLSARPYWRGNFSQQHHTDIPVYKGNPFRPPRDFQENNGDENSVERMDELSSTNFSVVDNFAQPEQTLSSGNGDSIGPGIDEMRS